MNIPPGLYTLRNRAKDRVLDSFWGNSVNNNPVNGVPPEGHECQKWELAFHGDQGYTLENKKAGTFLGFNGPVNQTPRVVTGGIARYWQVSPANPGHGYYITCAEDTLVGLALEDPNSEKRDIPVNVARINNALWQVWQLEHA